MVSPILDEIINIKNTTFDAVFLGDDIMAMACIQTLNQNKIKIPEQVAVVGFNNNKLCQYTNPALSSVEIYGKDVGKLTIDLLKRRLSTDLDLPLKVVMPYKYIKRNSCGT